MKLQQLRYLCEIAKLPRALLVPRGHPLAAAGEATLEAMSAHPLVTLDAGSHGQARMRELFRAHGLEPNIVLSGANIDVVKAFVEAGLGIAILPLLSFDPVRDTKLLALKVDHLFEPHRASIAIRRQHYLRGFAFDFIQTVAAGIDRASIVKAAAASITNRNGS